jgi:hypothetical protein
MKKSIYMEGNTVGCIYDGIKHGTVVSSDEKRTIINIDGKLVRFLTADLWSIN